MEPVIRQRLVGTLVLLALGIVFWPIIFVQPEVDQGIVLERTPPRPIIDETPIVKPESPREVILEEVTGPAVDPLEQAAADESTLMSEEQRSTEDGVESIRGSAEVDALTERRGVPEAPTRDGVGFAISWVLQVAAVSSRQQADALVNGLRNKGYEAFHRPVSGESSSLWRVQIGPKLEQAKLRAMKDEIDPAFNVDSKIIRYVQ